MVATGKKTYTGRTTWTPSGIDFADQEFEGFFTVHVYDGETPWPVGYYCEKSRSGAIEKAILDFPKIIILG
jgi:hypothetical protein